MKHVERLADEIVESGARRAFGIAGGGASLELIDHLEKRGVSFHLTHFEGTAVLMAGAMGYLSGVAHPAIGIKGPGLANMVPGLTACSFEGYPVVAITEAYQPYAPSKMAHKRIDHRKLVSAITKASRYFSTGGPSYIDMVNLATAEPPGPVHIDLSPSPVGDEEELPRFQYDVHTVHTAELREAVKLIEQAKRPVVIAGTLAIRLKLSKILNDLTIPVFSVASAKGVIDERLPHAAGVYSGAGLSVAPETSILKEADIVVCIALRHNEVLKTTKWTCPSINIDSSGNDASEGFGFSHLLSPGEDALGAIFSELAEKSWGAELVRESVGNIREHLMKDQFGHATVYSTLEKRKGAELRIVIDTGNFCTFGEHLWRVSKPDYYLSSGKGRYMGIAVPLAIGAALYDRSVPTVVVVGDGSVGMFIAELKLAVSEKVPLLLLFMKDGCFGSIKGRAMKDGFTQKPLTIGRPSWIEVAKSMGLFTASADTQNQLEDFFDSWNPDDGPCFLEIELDSGKADDLLKDVR